MKLEAILAIIIGIGIGLGVTFGIYKLRQGADSLSDQNTETTVTPSPTPPAEGKLLITSPVDESVVAETAAQVSGTSEANDMIVIFVNNNEFVTQADSIGAFAQNIELAAGGNIIEIKAIDKNGLEHTKTLHVVVSTADLDQAPGTKAASESAEPTTKPTGTVKPTVKPSATPKP